MQAMNLPINVGKSNETGGVKPAAQSQNRSRTNSPYVSFAEAMSTATERAGMTGKMPDAPKKTENGIPDTTEKDDVKQSKQDGSFAFSMFAALFAPQPDAVQDAADEVTDEAEQDAAAVTLEIGETSYSVADDGTVLTGMADANNAVSQSTPDTSNVKPDKPPDDNGQNTQQVVSILESQEEIGSLPAPSTQGNSVDREALARMPKAGLPDQPDNTEVNNKQNTGYVINDPYPLENENEQSASSEPDGDSDTKRHENVPVREKRTDEAQTDTANVPQTLNLNAEKIKSGETLTERALSQPVETRNLHSEIVERVELMSGDGKNEMTIQLKPEYLGRVTLKLQSDAGGLQVRITADDASVKSILDSRLSTLVESLEAKGVRVTNVDVVYAGISGNQPDDARAQERGDTQNGRPKRIRRLTDVSRTEDAAVDLYPEAYAYSGQEHSTVVYNA